MNTKAPLSGQPGSSESGAPVSGVTTTAVTSAKEKDQQPPRTPDQIKTPSSTIRGDIAIILGMACVLCVMFIVFLSNIHKSPQPLATASSQLPGLLGSRQSPCSENLKLLWGQAHLLSVKNEGTFYDNQLLVALRREGLAGECPDGTRYFVCNPTNFDENTTNKVFAYCPKHGNVLFADGSVRVYKSASLRQIESQLFNTNDVSMLLVWKPNEAFAPGGSSPGSYKSNDALLEAYAKALHGGNAQVEIQSGFYGGSYQVIVRVSNAGGIDRFSYTATLDSDAKRVTSWKLYEHN
jgi:prepilin-type processing-associated H-X9-DG protein